jgi:hypothetical protein
MLAKLLPRNEHPVERVLRVLVGLGLLSLVVLGPQTLWGLLGLILVVTGAVGSCPIYTALGVKTTQDGLP